MAGKATKYVGLGLTGLLVLLFLMSAVMKRMMNSAAAEQAAQLCVDPLDTIRLSGIVELLSAFLFIVPRTSVIGTILQVAYLGGAIAVHVQQQHNVIEVLITEA